jgi:hypothetical protein
MPGLQEKRFQERDIASVIEKKRLPGNCRCRSATTAATVISTIAVSHQFVPPAEVATSTRRTTVATTGVIQGVWCSGCGLMTMLCH